jgi:hypothetical protein
LRYHGGASEHWCVDARRKGSLLKGARLTQRPKKKIRTFAYLC